MSEDNNSEPNSNEVTPAEAAQPSAEQPNTADFDKEERNWAMGCHLASFAGFLIPFGNIIGPLVVWLVKKEEFPLVEDQGKEALNFQITVSLMGIVAAILVLVFIGRLLLLVLAIYWIVFTIIATMQANEGKSYRYPFTLRLIK